MGKIPMVANLRLVIAFVLLIVLTMIGTLGFYLLEDFSLLEAFYMTIITLSTVGFGEIRPLSPEARLFTSLIIIIGFGGLAFAGHAFAESIVENVWSGRSELRKMKKKIQHLRSHIIVCGYGRVGTAAVDHIEKSKTDFVVIEADEQVVHQIKEKGYYVLHGDSTSEEILLDAGIKRASGLLSLLDSDPDNLFVVLTARELNPMLHIISRAAGRSPAERIKRAGADTVISPLATAGRQIAEDLLAATGNRLSAKKRDRQEESRTHWIEISGESELRDKTVGDLFMDHGLQAIGLQRGNQDTLLPIPETVLLEGDRVLVAGPPGDLPISIRENRENVSLGKKVVIVDDNPVIVSLYTRLFRKAGFMPVSANDGPTGLATILREKPDVAVIDFQIPVFSGIEVCRRVRETVDRNTTRLILFTSDSKEKTRQMALRNGVDKVVVKSPEASEVIETVIQSLGDR
jgi:voltage-gated potassium channel